MASVMNYGRVLALVVALAVAASVNAKGVFQAKGVISDFQKHGDEVTFKFVGEVSFGYATAPNDDPKRVWKDVTFTVTGIAAQVGGWMQARTPGVRAETGDIERVCSRLAEFSKNGRAVRFSLDNPTLGFSNAGQLERIIGTYIYVVDADQ